MRFLFVIFLVINVFAENNNISNDQNKTKIIIKNELNKVIKLENSNNWIIQYNNYLLYKSLRDNYLKILHQIRFTHNREKKRHLREVANSLKERLELFSSFKDNKFGILAKIEDIKEPFRVNNPFSIFSGFSYISNLKSLYSSYEDKYNNLLDAINLIKERIKLKKSLGENTKLDNNILEDFVLESQIYKTKLIYLKNQIETNIKITQTDIKYQLKKLRSLAIAIFISIFVFLFLKKVVLKYMKSDDSEKVYIINKILNFLNIFVIILIIAFFYIQNVSYLITILGFASAGLAIALKDWFMNIFGWFVIVVNGNFHVGDRIMFYRDGKEIMGDVVDISLTRIILQEDVSYIAYKKDKRAGRIIFIPNNYIFNTTMYNYTHAGLNTVWDTIEINITFDSNHKKAKQIVNQIILKNTTGYIKSTNNKLKKLSTKYHVRNMNTSPRVFTFIESYGIKVSAWYVNYYATLNLKSLISAEIIEAFKQEEDIEIAYPTQYIKIDKI